jgi:translation initiation factor 2-alpha kinase 4
MTDREIQVLSIVNHKHVVRYFNCWIEEPQGPVKHSNTEDVESSASTPQAADSGSDIFAPGIPNDPFAYRSADNSTSLRFPDTRYGVPGRSKDPSRNKFWASADSDDDSDEEGSVEESGSDSGEETESEHPVAKPNEKRNGVVSASVPSSALTDASSADPGSVRTLYIAMEFVDNVSPLSCFGSRRELTK